MEEEKAKKISKKARIAELEEELAGVQTTNQALKQKLERQTNLMSNVGTIAFIIICIGLFVFVVHPFEGNYYPCGKNLADNYVSAKSEYDDGEMIFNLEGYLKENGFKHYNIHYSDDNLWSYITVTARNKIWGLEITTTVDKHWSASGPDYEYSTRVEFYHLGAFKSRDYTITYYTENEFSPTGNDFVMDTDSSMMLARKSLEEIDAVFKAKTHDEKSIKINDRLYLDNCPFKGTGILHYVEAGGIVSDSANVHDD